MSKGSKFALALKEIPILDIVSGVEEGLRQVPRDKKPFKDCARAKITLILKRASPPPDNLTPQERKAISELKSCDDIVILEADKGNCTVVMNKIDYTTKMMVLLNDKKTYKVLTRNPVPVIEKRLNSFIWKLRHEEKISFSNYKSLRSCDSVLPRIYGFYKIHKTNAPFRLIVSFIGSATYHLSTCLKCILSPLLGKTNNFTTKNSTEFVRSIKDFSISDSQKQESLVYSPPYHLV